MKYSGVIGFSITRPGTEDDDDIWEAEQLVEKPYYGDVLQVTQRWDQNPESVNPNMRITNRISIVADGFAVDHMGNMKYISYEGVRWNISSIEVKRPRLIFTLGGMYHGPTP